MARVDPQILAHLEWLGFVRPTGLVVSAPALVRAGATLPRTDTEGQRLLNGCVTDPEAERPVVSDFRSLATDVLSWAFTPKYYAGPEDRPIPEALEVTLPDFGETLRPDFAVADPEPGPDASPWQLLVRVEPSGRDLDEIYVHQGSSLEATAQGRMERLLRQTGVSAGVLFNGEIVRLVSAPRGESSGWLDFRVADMLQTAGRPICAAMRLLLRQHTLLQAGTGKRLVHLLEDSRKFQNEVSERLAEQVLHALYELLRGFQAAHDQSRHVLLREVLSEHPDQVYRGLLNVLLRLVFLLYAEERDMLPEDETFLQHYSLAGLYERLREDAALNPDTMDQRYGAWSQLLVVFRMIYDGAEWGGARIPERHGVLFDPDRFPFLEGRLAVGARQVGEGVEPPKVPDGTVYRVLEKLLVLDGERISYRALDVEQIGSVYETMMGFRLETATGRSIAIKAGKKHGAPTTVDLDALLAQPSPKRPQWLQDHASRKVPAGVNREVKDADTLEALHAALEKVVETAATPDLVPRGAMVLQPSEERRKSGSHYTPRELTEPIVSTTLRPVLERLREEAGDAPTPEQILDLKVCDPAMGSGAFLVETCRQLGDALLEAWQAHGGIPELPPDEDEVVFARRLVARRCLYGVDRNPVAVDLAKVSLWLATLAKDHPFTFLDHALRHGDSLVGLSRKQIEAFHWDPDAPRFQAGFEAMRIQDHLDKVAELRGQIRRAGEDASDQELRHLWDAVAAELDEVRLYGDLVVAAFLEGRKAGERETKRRGFATAMLSGKAEDHRSWLEELRSADPPLAPFHWEVELPEVFDRELPGFDAVVGNPPFLGGTRISTVLGMTYFQWLKYTTPGAGHLCDLVAYFFRRCFSLLRDSGAFGLVATNTIAQGDTREGGLTQIRRAGGTIYSAVRRLIWPGRAAVRVSIIHILKGRHHGPCWLDGARCPRITSFLFTKGGDESPQRLKGRNKLFSAGSKIYGQGFLFAEDDAKASPLALMDDVIRGNPSAKERIFPYLGGSELNNSPTQSPHRYVIYLSDVEQEEDLARYPELGAIVREKVKPYRDKLGDNPNNIPLKQRWWAYQAHRPRLYSALESMERALVGSQTAKYITFALVPANLVFSQKLNVFLLEEWAAFAVMQSRLHEAWALFFGSSMKDDPVYTPSDCFETFPFPEKCQSAPGLEAAGHSYYGFRADLMVRHDEGLTKTYNRFHDPEEQSPDIVKLRELHAAMDRAVLDAYGWNDVATDCEFLLDYDEENEKGSRRKKPWRYRWPDEVHDEVLARLLELNAQQAEEERLAGAAAPSGGVVEDLDDRTPDLFDG